MRSLQEFVYHPLDDKDCDIYSDPNTRISPIVGMKARLAQLELQKRAMESGDEVVVDNGEVIMSGSLYERVKEVIDIIRVYVKSDGGDIEFHGIKVKGDEKWVQVKFLANCNGCGSFGSTYMGLEESLLEEVPGLAGIDVIRD